MKEYTKNLIALAVLCVTVGVIGATSSVFADDEGGVPKCNCRIVNGPDGDVFGRIIGEDCFPNPCWVEIE